MADALDGLTAALAERYQLDVGPDGRPRELGQGGMATVYLARDLKHQRKVAVKLIRPTVAAAVGAERFLHEIQVTANLQHPHILGLIDSGVVRLSEASGAPVTWPYYVMPYVEGESLRQKLTREIQLPVEEALAITQAVASALDYAHRHGVIHRDIKPENILLHEGQALVADFGIALALTAAGGARLTETGVALGTPQYMSPEQGVGTREVGPRSDIFALGCVLYEMLAGEPPFTGPTAQAIFAKTVRDTPPSLRVGRPSVPVHVEAAVSKALEKLPADRFVSASEFAQALDAGGKGERTRDRDNRSEPQSSAHRPLAITGVLAVAAIVVTALGVWGWSRRGRPAPSITARLDLSLPLGASLHEDAGPALAVAPDGASFVYVAEDPAGTRLHRRDIDRHETRPLPGTEGASQPFFSPDGQWVGFVQSGSLRKVALNGAAPVTISDAPGGLRGASWGIDDSIVFCLTSTSGLWRVSASGGPPEVLATPDTTSGEAAFRWPEVLPSGRAVLYMSAAANPADSRIEVMSLDTRKVVRVAGGASPHFTATGHVTFVQADGAIGAVPFDADRLAVSGPVVPLRDSVDLQAGGYASYGISANGTFIGVPRSPPGRSLVTVNRAGAISRATKELKEYREPRFSPDGGQIALSIREGAAIDLWTLQQSTGMLSRRTFGDQVRRPLWTPDGKRIVFTAVRAGRIALRLKPWDGSGVDEALPGGDNLYAASWSRDGKTLVASDGRGAPGRIVALAPERSNPVRRVVPTPSLVLGPRLSPDGHWLAYTSDESGEREVYVQPFPRPGGRWQVSTGDARNPVWAPDGRELFFWSGVKLVSVAIETHAGFKHSAPRVLFEVPPSIQADDEFDIHPDGRRFVMVHRPKRETRLVVVLNWFDEWARGTHRE